MIRKITQTGNRIGPRSIRRSLSILRQQAHDYQARFCYYEEITDGRPVRVGMVSGSDVPRWMIFLHIKLTSSRFLTLWGVSQIMFERPKTLVNGHSSCSSLSLRVLRPLHVADGSQIRWQMLPQTPQEIQNDSLMWRLETLR